MQIAKLEWDKLTKKSFEDGPMWLSMIEKKEIVMEDVSIKNQEKAQELQKALDKLINTIEAEKMTIKVSWMDEYSGIQSIIKQSYDNITIENER